jgi:hypothetical protein
MGHGKNELVADTIYAYRSANDFHFGVLGIIKDEMVSVEVRQQASSYTTSNLRRLSQVHRTTDGIQYAQLECG